MKSYSKVIIKDSCFRKMCLHSARYINNDVIGANFYQIYLFYFYLGVLVGEIENNQVTLCDAYPLFHSRILQPMLEVAFNLVAYFLIEAQISANKKRIILGIYESLISFEQNSEQISEISGKILEQIQQCNQIMPVFVKVLYKYKHKKFEIKIDEYDEENEETTKFTLNIYQVNKPSQSTDYQVTELNDNILNKLPFLKLREDLKENNHILIIDFDLHFENCALDFTNSFIQEEIQEKN